MSLKYLKLRLIVIYYLSHQCGVRNDNSFYKFSIDKPCLSSIINITIYNVTQMTIHLIMFLFSIIKKVTLKTKI